LIEDRCRGRDDDEEIDPRESQRLAQRLHLVRVDLDPGTERRLEEDRVRRRNAAPATACVKKRGKAAGRIEPSRGKILPPLFFENPAVGLVVPSAYPETAPLASSAQARPARHDCPGAGGGTTSSTSPASSVRTPTRRFRACVQATIALRFRRSTGRPRSGDQMFAEARL
jgi:hypothetical protein